MTRFLATILSCMACAPAFGALQPMDDASMAEVSGQAGISLTTEFPAATGPVANNDGLRGFDISIIDTGGIDETATGLDFDYNGDGFKTTGVGANGAFKLQNFLIESEPILLDWGPDIAGTGRPGFILTLDGSDLETISEWGIVANSSDVIDDSLNNKIADLGLKYPQTGAISITAPDPLVTSSALVLETHFPSTGGNPFADGGMDFFIGDEDGYNGSGNAGYFDIFDIRLNGSFLGEADVGTYANPSIVLTPQDDQVVSFGLGITSAPFSAKTDLNTIGDFITRIPGGTSLTLDTAATGNAVQIKFRGNYVTDLGVTNIVDGDALFNMDGFLTGEPGIRLDVDGGDGTRDPALVVSPLITGADLQFALQLGTVDDGDNNGVPDLQESGDGVRGTAEPGGGWYNQPYIDANKSNLMGIAKISGLDMTGTNIRISAQ